MSLIIALALWYPGAALPPIIQTLGTNFDALSLTGVSKIERYLNITERIFIN